MIPFFSPDLSDYGNPVVRQIESGWVGPGETCKEFAAALKDYTKAEHVLLTTSGTVALYVAARILNLKKVTVPAYGVIATANALASAGASVEFADVDRETGCLSVRTLESADPSAICYVDFSGRVGLEVEKLNPIIEDAACGLGHWYNGKHAGTFGRIGVLSFSPHKVITTGQGGALLFQKAEDYEKAKQFIDHGRPTHEMIGMNLRMSDVQASLGLAQLKRLNKILLTKERVSGILPGYKTPSGVPLHNIIFAEKAQELVNNLRSKGIQAARQYATLNRWDCYKSKDKFPNADYWSDHAVYLPFGNGLREWQAHMISGFVS